MFKEIKKGLVQGGAFVFILAISGISYAAFPNILTVSDGEQLTSGKWNEIVNRLNSIDQKQLATAWVSFEGTSCTGGGGNECTIESEYNVDRIIKNSSGNYTLYFSTGMDNDDYSGNINAGTTNPGAGARIGLFGGYPYRGVPFSKTTTNVNLAISNVDNNLSDANGYISVQVFGGKN